VGSLVPAYPDLIVVEPMSRIAAVYSTILIII